MRRLGLLALLPGLVLWAFACDGDTTPPSFFDSGADATTSDVVQDGPGPDVVTTTHAKVIVVHASPDVPTVRVCFAIGLQNDGSDGVIAPISPLPQTGLAPGTGGALPDLGIDLSQRALTPYVILASKITSSAARCDTLAGDAGSLTPNVDYFVLPTIKNGTLAPSTTFLVAATGCMPNALDPAADTTTCGASYDSTKGNLSLQIFALDRVIGNTQRFGAQVAHVSSPAAGVWSSSYGSTAVSAALKAFDGGAQEIIVDSVQLDLLAPSSAASLAMPTVDQTSFVVAPVNPDGGAPPTSVSIPLPLVYEATTGKTTGENAYFTPGTNYTFVFVGDPRVSATLDGGAFNGYSLHALAFPNDPTSSSAVMDVHVLGTGSSGNSLLVEAEDTRLLVEAGIGPRNVVKRAQGLGVELFPRGVDGIVVTHHHDDHAAQLEPLCKAIGAPRAGASRPDAPPARRRRGPPRASQVRRATLPRGRGVRGRRASRSHDLARARRPARRARDPIEDAHARVLDRRRIDLVARGRVPRVV